MYILTHKRIYKHMYARGADSCTHMHVCVQRREKNSPRHAQKKTKKNEKKGVS